jgi:hypothetical protein
MPPSRPEHRAPGVAPPIPARALGLLRRLPIRPRDRPLPELGRVPTSPVKPGKLAVQEQAGAATAATERADDLALSSRMASQTPPTPTLRQLPHPGIR